MNAKACTVVELYGTLDPVTRDWTDGLLSCIFREINKPTDKNERKYIVFDSDVDALWVENMNSVMDDNRLLTLANGERIRLQKHCALLFEVNRFLFHAVYAVCSLISASFILHECLKWERSRRNSLQSSQFYFFLVGERIDHFRVPLCHWFKASLSAKLFLRK